MLQAIDITVGTMLGQIATGKYSISNGCHFIDGLLTWT